VTDDRVPTYTTRELYEKLKPIARQMRSEPTPAEDRLWQRIRKEQIGGIKFRRQHHIDRFIVDFYAPQVRLVIEVDGSVHEYTQEEDAVRQQFLETLGLRVIRFTNEEVFGQLEAVLEKIGAVVGEV
jgi:very-short-patch-repair endonuclease